MLTRKTTKIFIVVLCCLPFLTTALVWMFWASVLPVTDEDSAVAERFTSYQAVLPNVTYKDIVVTFQLANGEYAPTAEDVEQLESEGEFVMPKFEGMKINDAYSPLSKELNSYLYAVCQTYASGMYVGDIKLSPLLPLAEANQEGGRVDRSQTFSAMAHTSAFTYSSVEELRDFNVTRVLDSESTWRQLSTEYYTRDRGELQCNPNYGANNPDYGPSEKDLLDAYVAEHGMPDYGTNKDSRGNRFTVEDWINTSRTKYGDRFNVESMVRMFADEKRNVEIPGILKHFPDVQNEWQVYCIMAYNHWCGSGFMTMDRSTAYAGWKSVARADEYCKDLSSPAAIEIIYSQCLQEIQDARAAGRYPVRCIDKRSGMVIYDKLVEAGAVKEWDYYFRHKVNASGTWDQGATACTYPIGIIYGVMQMTLLYSGY